MHKLIIKLKYIFIIKKDYSRILLDYLSLVRLFLLVMLPQKEYFQAYHLEKFIKKQTFKLNFR